MNITIAQGPSMAAVKALLLANGLPVEDLSALTSDDFLYCGEATAPMGVIGLECFGAAGLLRSLVIAEAGRNQGFGQSLVAALELKATQLGVCDLFLLTETAESFFVKLGYEPISRAAAPVAIKQTREFSDLCPDDAALMCKKLAVVN